MRSRVNLLAAALLLCVGICCGSAHAAGLLVADGGGLLDIEEHSVDVTINNGIAVTRVTQVFRNTEDRTVEALYTFPVPKSASIAGFSMWINGREMIGEVVEKQAAREIYNSYKAVRRDPGLLEQTDYRTFELRIFPIGPKALQKVQVTYYQELDVDGEWATYVYPLSSNSRQVVNSRVSKGFTLTADVKSATPILSMSSPSHARDLHVMRHSDTYDRATITTQNAGLDRDVVLAYQIPRGQTGATLLASRPTGGDGFFYLTLTARAEPKPSSEGMDYVFLLDVSGSMRDDDKLGQSRQTLAAFVDMLADNDRFDLIAFNQSPVGLFRELKPADEADKKAAGNFLTSLRPRGGTDLNAALARAYTYAQPGRALNIVLISDGLAEQSRLPRLMRLVSQRPAATRILCVGLGNNVDRALLQRLADQAGGAAAFLSADDDFPRQAAALRRKLRSPVITNASIQIAGVNVHDVEPPQLSSLYDGVPAHIYGRYNGSGPAQITLTGQIEGKPYSQSMQLTFPEQEDANPEIERMWAWRRIDRLLNQPGSSKSAAINEIVRLGETYSIATEYTSFIVLENDAEYSRWKIAQQNALRLTRDRDAQQELAKQLDTLRQQTPGGLGEPTPGLVRRPTPGGAVPAMAAAPLQSGPSVETPTRSPGMSAGAVDPFSAGLMLMIAVIALLALRSGGRSVASYRP